MNWQKILKTALCCLLLTGGQLLRANNLTIGNDVRVISSDNSSFTLQLSLSWENAWHDDYNFDAVWLFVKYRTASSSWNHLYLSPDGHQMSGGANVLCGGTGSEVVGIFVYPPVGTGGRITVNAQVKCVMPAAISKTDLDARKVFFAVQGVEMAYVPSGPYFLGDDVSDVSFSNPGGGAVWIGGENEPLTLADKSGASDVLGADYPKGYDGFFCMKTEITQKQYVAFLNMLSFAEQAARIPKLAAMNNGVYVFGADKGSSVPVSRNGIAVYKKSTTSTIPFVFANNLNSDGQYNQADDGQSLPCGFLNYEDMYAYCAWTGLRPMSELEYEKACRPVGPEKGVDKAYAWNTAVAGTISAGDLLNKNTGKEYVSSSSKNVNGGGLFNGPVKTGAFAVSATSAEQAGATCWGIMEMSGNLREMCIHANAGNLLDRQCGYGDLGFQPWSDAGITEANIGVRGGGYTSDLARLRVADRMEMTGVVNSGTPRDPTIGFRAVRSFPAVSAGVIAASNGKTKDSVCLGSIAKILSASAPAMTGATYSWMMKTAGGDWTLLTGKTAQTLDYTPGALQPGNNWYSFCRIATGTMGAVVSNVVDINFINNDLQLNRLRDTVDQCGIAGVIEAAHALSGSIIWKQGAIVLESIPRVSGAEYLPESSVAAAGSVGILTCVSQIGKCSQAADVSVYVAPPSSDPSTDCWLCGDLVKDADGNSYTTKMLADNQCWMTQSLRKVTPDSRIQPGADPLLYGRLYTWNDAMDGRETPGARGLCPAGWSLPTYADWDALITALGGAAVAGQIMKDPTEMNMTLSGLSHKAGAFAGKDEYGDYWSSTMDTDTSRAIGKTVHRDNNEAIKCTRDKGDAIAVRCIKK